MKKYLFVLLVFAIMLTFISCSSCKHDDPTKIVVCEAKAPTCQEAGLTEGMKCTLCDTMVVPQTVVPKIDCIESDWIVDKEATKTEDGKKHTECTMCHRKMQDVVLPAGSKGLSYVLNDDGKGYSVTGIGNCTDRDIVIPRTYNDLPVTSIGDAAFFVCTSLSSVVIPDSVTTIGDAAFYGCDSLTSIDVDDNNQNYKSVDGNLYSKDGKTLIQYAIGKQDSSFVIPDSVTTIGDYAFFVCTSLSSVVIPDSVTTIGESAFNHCTSLTSVVIGDSVTSIGYGAFHDCYSLTSIVIGDSVTTIGDLAFYLCTSLTSIVIPDSVTTIGDLAFYLCTSLTSVVIGDSVTTIGNSAFSNCSSLASVKFEGTVEQWNAISLGRDWNYKVPATEVICSDGTVRIK
jgi:hypothetical protein